MKTNLPLLTLVVTLGGCAGRVLVLQAPVISMSKTDIPAGMKMAELGDVNETWCTKEEPMQPEKDGSKNYGMIDQAIMKATDNGKKGDFITDARFYQDVSCMNVQGKLARAAK